MPQIEALLGLIWKSAMAASKKSHLVRRLRDAVKKINGDFVQELQEFHDVTKCLKELGEVYSNEGVNYFSCTSMCNEGIYEADFGWGSLGGAEDPPTATAETTGDFTTVPNLNDFPDLILSFLPTLDAIRTTCLSHKWRNLWFSLSSLNFDYPLFPPSDFPSDTRRLFTNFVDQALIFLQPLSPLMLYFQFDFREYLYLCFSLWNFYSQNEGRRKALISLSSQLALHVIQNPKNYGALKCIAGIEDLVLRKQMESLESILLSMNQTLVQFLVKAGSIQAAPKQLQQRIGMKPSLADCLDALSLIYEMHQSEYILKASIVLALSALALKPRYAKRCSSSLYLGIRKPSLCGSDLGALQQLLVDQPNIPKEEVQSIFDIVFAEEIC
ncbi:hypothetical protein TEA_022807 [Camellia sinensis var. sinensis]|uniref:F-box domain-containing protein n=1 Tax=Camellia sinensis var. sinensis TaxID=542762 RepID=A0A4S4EC09_CAMSN|nr:hypothetical protein TEA_022807 [Camellia sinensis var. sinensis]